MKMDDGPIEKTTTLRATIGVISRGGPLKVIVFQQTKPVLLKGMPLPAEACYAFTDPTDTSSNYVNNPVSIEIFFGDNGSEAHDTPLGAFPLQEFLPPFVNPGDIKLKLLVNTDQLLSIHMFENEFSGWRGVGYVDISTLQPPDDKSMPTDDASKNFAGIPKVLMEIVENTQPRRTGIPRRGKDLSQNVTISFDKALQGGSQAVETFGTRTCSSCAGSGSAPGKALSMCSACQGTGWEKEKQETPQGPLYHARSCTVCRGDGWVNLSPCPTCRGSGWTQTKRSAMLRIPAYIDSGAVVCCLHQGEPGRFGGLPGHLRITVNVAPHSFLSRIGRDVCVNLPVSDGIAKRGGRVRVPALERGKSFLLDLPARTRNNSVFPVSENAVYTLTARIETYNPTFLFLQPEISQRVQAIEKRLEGAKNEKPEIRESGLAEQIAGPGAYDVDTLPPSAGPPPNQAEFYVRRGKMFVEKGDWEHAMLDFTMAIKTDPGYAEAYDRRSVLLISQKQPEKAFRDVNRALELSPDNAEYYYHRGMLHHVQNDFPDALADYTRALELDPGNADVFESRGKANILQKNLDAARDDFTKALELDPTKIDCYYKRGLIHQNKKDPVKAVADFTMALGLDPDNDSIRSDRGQVYVQMNDLENALADAQKLMEKHSGNAGAYNNRGYVYYLQKEYDKALADFNKALEINPKLVHALNNRGKIHLQQSDFQQAVEDFERSLSLKPDDPWVFLWLGQTYRSLGEKRKAVEYCRKALHAGENPELRREAQMLLSSLGSE
jgi:tetratricopeptide (TPR) repeat protein